ncbi:Uncharacterized protein M6B38_222900 [Iris pallida]|uniref:Uncharacterized protein n=1 Tax=Iris pallida TaxID=29817 RepID=A0AAX6DWW3_IRIPA|nr:Uncharacterized protein M6B38_222900 [Iris pallida]
MGKEAVFCYGVRLDEGLLVGSCSKRFTDSLLFCLPIPPSVWVRKNIAPNPSGLEALVGSAFLVTCSTSSKPFFGMFGYGGPIASMHLGRYAIVSSKTKESQKVYTLHLSREALLSRASGECIWRTDGGIRDPLEGELELSPHGSYTQEYVQF